jgi:LemA protein
MGRANLLKVTILLTVLIIIIGIYSVSTYNSLVLVTQDIDTKWNQVENQLQHKLTLIPDVIDTSQAYTEQDEEAFAIINESRSKLARAETVGQKAQADADLSRGLSQLCKAVKQHSAIEADTACQQMLNKMTVTEENVATARRDYNEAVRGYNTYIKGFPANIVAGVGGFGRRPYFEAGEMAPIDEQ